MGPASIPILVCLTIISAVIAAISLTGLGSGPTRRDGTARRQLALRSTFAALLLALVGLNLYQWFTRPAAPMDVQASVRPVPTSGALPSEPPTSRPLTGQPMTDREIADLYHEWFYKNLETTWNNSSWLGVKALQNPNDVWIHQEIISEVKPDYIIEAGAAYGGGALIWATILQQVNPAGKVVTIDIEDLVEEARKVPLWSQKVEFIKGSSTDPAIVADLAKRTAGRRVIVILDSDHSKAHVLNELKAYAPLVPVGSYLIVQDTNINGRPVNKEFGPGPGEAVDEFLASNHDFEPDVARERFLFTMHPKGYLRRVK